MQTLNLLILSVCCTLISLHQRLTLDSAKYESKFPYWTHLHGFWQTLPNFNPQPLSSDPGQEIGDEMEEFITDRANSEATGANVTGNISRGNVKVSDLFHVCHNISDQHSQGGKLDAIMAGLSGPVLSSLVSSCIMTPHSGISSTRPKRKHNANVTKTLHQQKSTFLIPSYSILLHLTTSYSSYFEGKKGISRNKTSFFLLMFEPALPPSASNLTPQETLTPA